MNITRALCLSACVLLAACGGGDDSAEAGDVWTFPPGGPATHSSCTATTTSPNDALILVTVSLRRTLSVEQGSLGIRDFVRYSMGTDGVESTVAIGVQEGARPQNPLQTDARTQFWVAVNAGKPLTVDAMAEARGLVQPGAVLTTSACSIQFSR